MARGEAPMARGEAPMARGEAPMAGGDVARGAKVTRLKCNFLLLLAIG